jgi:hypothetical protein
MTLSQDFGSVGQNDVHSFQQLSHFALLLKFALKKKKFNKERKLFAD